MAQESEAERSVVIDPRQTVFRGFSYFADRVDAQVCKLRRLHIAPCLFNRIELWSVSREPLDAKPIALAGNPLRHASAAM
jgi:hypothetical protein